MEFTVSGERSARRGRDVGFLAGTPRLAWDELCLADQVAAHHGVDVAVPEPQVQPHGVGVDVGGEQVVGRGLFLVWVTAVS